MSNRTALVAQDLQETHEPRPDMFGDLPDFDLLELKYDEVATGLNALMVHSHRNRSSMAKFLRWQRSRVTKVLDGESNPTVKTLCQFSWALGYDFDVVYRLPGEQRPDQPWEKRALAATAAVIDVRLDFDQPHIVLAIQTADEVANDISDGRAQSHYISLSVASHVETDSSLTAIISPTLSRTRAIKVLDGEYQIT